MKEAFIQAIYSIQHKYSYIENRKNYQNLSRQRIWLIE